MVGSKTSIEELILANALRSKAIALAATDYLKEDDFDTSHQHREIFKAIKDAVNSDHGYNSITLAQACQRNVIDTSRIVQLRAIGAKNDSTEEEVQCLIQILKENNEREDIGRYARDLSIMASDEQVSMSNIRESLSGAIELITPPSLRSGNSISVIGDRFRKNIDRPSDTILTGFESVDIGMNGFPKKEVSAIVGTAGSGKTSMALAMAYNVSRIGKNVAYYCFEMAEEKMYEKILAHHGNIPYFILERRKPQEIERWKDTIVEKSAELDNFGLQIFDESVTPDLDRLIDSIRYRVARNNVEFVVIDYLQKVPVPNVEREYDRITKVSDRLTFIAKECNIAILALVQPNNAYERRMVTEGGLPSLIDMHGSGQIAKDAANVLFIIRRRYGKDFANTGTKHQFYLPFHETQLYYLKGRFGETPQMFGNLAFIPSYSKYVNVSWNQADGNERMTCPSCSGQLISFELGRIKCKGCGLDQPFIDKEAKSGLIFKERDIDIYGNVFKYDYAFLKKGNYQSDTIARNIDMINRRLKTLDGEPIKRISFADGTPLEPLVIGNEETYEEI